MTDRVLIGHGSGGRLSAELLERVFLPAFDDELLRPRGDAAICPLPEGGRLAFTTDAFVVRPLFFPGGDIGRLAVSGTVNDLAVSGARPLWLSAAFVLEEGLPLEILARIVASMRATCLEAGVRLVTGDTKVVDRGKGDGVYVATSGVGHVPAGRDLSLARARPGDRVVVTGTLGDHGIAVLSVREGLAFETTLESDAAPLADLVETMLAAAPGTSGLRDPTRGGLAATANELAAASGQGVELDEDAIPVRPEVRAACEILGFDVLDVANEGKVVAVVPEEEADRLVAAARAHPRGRDAAIVGRIVEGPRGLVTMRSRIGSRRIVPMPAGEPLPRIC